MKIATKIKINIFLFIGFSLIMVTAFLVMASRIDESLRNDSLIDRILSGVNDLNTATYDFVLHPGQGSRMQWELKHASLETLIQSVTTDEKILIEQIGRNHGLAKILFDKLVQKSDIWNKASPKATIHDEDSQRLVAQLIARTRMVSTDTALLTRANTASILSLNRKSFYVVLSITLLMLWIVSSISLLLKDRIAKSFRKLNEGTLTIAAGDLGHRTGMASSDEFGELSKAFDIMAEKLENTTVSRDALSREAKERRRAEEELRKSHDELEVRVRERTAELEKAGRTFSEQSRLLEAFFEHTITPLCFLDRNFNFIRVNEAYARADGRTPVQFIGLNHFDLYPSNAQEIFEEVVRSKKPYQAVARPFTYPEHPERGTTYWDWLLVPLLNERGEVDSLVFSLNNVTEQKLAELELRAYANRLELVNQELQEFAFVASHDLQEPLRKIQSFGNMLRTKCAAELDETGKDYLVRMEKAAARMRQLIQDLLEFSRVATNPQPYKSVNLNGVLQEVIQVFEFNFAKFGAKIEVAELPVIDADETQLKQLFQNLIGNALKYRKKDTVPEIKIYSRLKDKRHCQLLIEDNGIGFEQIFAQKIFSPFQRLHNRDEFEGTGMGLAICRKIVERHGGTITAASQPGKGSIFTIDMPFRQAGSTQRGLRASSLRL